MADVQLNIASLTTTSATTAPASGTSETWTVTALAAGIRTLVAGVMTGTYFPESTTLDAWSGARWDQEFTDLDGAGIKTVILPWSADYDNARVYYTGPRPTGYRSPAPSPDPRRLTTAVAPRK